LFPRFPGFFQYDGPQNIRNRECCPALVLRHCRPAKSGEARHTFEEKAMLSWVVTFLVIALIAGLLGFGGIAGASIEIAKIVFFIAIVLFLVSAVMSIVRGRTNV